MATKPKLSAMNLKNTLWETLQNVKNGKTNPAEADSIASQAREILRTTNVQLKISQQSNTLIPKDVLDFSQGN